MLKGTVDNLALAHADASGSSFQASGERVCPRFIYPWNLLSSPHQLASEARLSEDVQRETLGAGSNGDPGCDSDSAWWLVYTKSRQEKVLSDQLVDMRVPHYLPVHHREAVTRGRVRVVEEPLFAGYLFLFASDDQRREALTTNRISVTHRVTPSDAERLPFELANIAQSIASGARLTLESAYEPGDWVRVKAGQYEGLEGAVLKRKNRTKLVLSVNFLKQGASFEIADCYLERIDPPEFNDAGCVEIVGRRRI